MYAASPATNPTLSHALTQIFHACLFPNRGPRRAAHRGAVAVECSALLHAAHEQCAEEAHRP
eukprot:1155839-Pelagomonas_calceolata.AAC.16